jgi:nicotinamide riboside transporter PnuC
MKKLNRILSEYIKSLDMYIELGEEKEIQEDKVTDSTINMLEEYRRRKDAVFIVYISILICLFIGSFTMVIYNLDDPGTIKTIFTVTGISFSGIIVKIHDIWKIRLTIDIVLLYLVNLKPKNAGSIIKLLLDKLLKK